jgi:hypothetical protein
LDFIQPLPEATGLLKILKIDSYWLYGGSPQLLSGGNQTR